MLTERASGVLLHISSLPSRAGIGDLGPSAYAFADFLAAAQQKFWQILPLGPTGYGNSPYSAISAFAGNPLFISLEILADQGWIEHSDLAALSHEEDRVDFERAAATKTPLLEQAAHRFLDRATGGVRDRFEVFRTGNAHWLDDFAQFSVLRRLFGGASWHAWPEEFSRRTPEGIKRLQTEHGRELATEQVIQFFFDEQWRDLRRYCTERNVRFIGDVAIFVNYDSAAVWVRPDLFELDENREPIRVSGVPPDYFSPTGQRWGNPLYRWDAMANGNFAWWVARIGRALDLCDMVRLDHFRGFEAYWAIPAADTTAVNGSWVQAPGMQLFARLREELGDLPLIAEDLGVITRQVNEMRTAFSLPGMRVLQFGFSDRGAHLHLPHRCEENMSIYTGTHDNDTTLAWWHGTNRTTRDAIAAYLHPGDDGIVWAMIRAAACSVARLCLFPMQDVLGLGSSARMNTPAQPHGNWGWRYCAQDLQPWIAEKLAALMAVTDRDNWTETSGTGLQS